MAHDLSDFTAGDTGSKLRISFIDVDKGTLIRPFSGVYNASIIVKPQGGVAAERVVTVLSGADDGYGEYTFLGAELLVGTTQTQVKLTKVSDASVVRELRIKNYTVGAALS